MAAAQIELAVPGRAEEDTGMRMASSPDAPPGRCSHTVDQLEAWDLVAVHAPRRV